MKLTLRTKKTQHAYEVFKNQRPNSSSCLFCDKKIIKKYKYWNLFVNDFPYDMVFKVHHLLAPKRHVTDFMFLKPEEKKEYYELRKKFYKKYGVLLENLGSEKSIKNHFHVHLLIYRKNLKF